MKAIKEKMATIGRSNTTNNSNSASASGTNTRPPLPTKGSKRQPPPPPPQQQQEKEKEKAASPPPAPSPSTPPPKEEDKEEGKALSVEVPPENGGGGAEGGSSSSSSSESSYFIFSPTPPVSDRAGAPRGQGPGSRLAGVVFGDEEGGKGGAAATGVSTAQASLGIAERIAGFLSLRDLGAYFGLDELGSKSFSAVRTGVDRLLGPLSLLRLVECALAAAQYTGRATAVVAVTVVEFARGGVAGIVRQVFAAVDALARLALAAVRELRRLSLRDLLRTLLLFLSERLDTGGHGRESDEAGVSSSKGPLLGSMGSSLKTALFHSFKDLDEISAENGSDRGAGAAASLLLLGGGGEMGSGDWGFIPQRNAGLGRPSTKMGLVVAYREKNENVTHVTKQKVRRMMHYRVPLKPFEATIVCARPREQQALEEEEAAGATSGGMHAGAGGGRGGRGKGMGAAHGEGEGDGVVFPSVMCTPQSFPPTPISRACVMARFSQFSDDVVYLARDQLRLEELVKAEDDVTKMAAESLKQQACLAVFNSEDTANGIVLSCGGHCATKVGTTTLYTSTRAMVPIMRNRHVFFQMSIMAEETAAVASLCAGLSTPEMPLNTLVGSWKYSIGLCSTGQILVGSRWLTSSSTKQSHRFGCGCTVGVLVHIDECRVSDSWDGELVEAFIKFSVNGVPVILEGQPGGGEVTPLFIPKDDDVYPTLTLHSPSTQVLGRFCSADILHPHRALIGAPPGVPVYALDGSVILKPDQELGSTTL